jgi:ubiquinone/menaquinone biosynthesis C-methylase UbiE
MPAPPSAPSRPDKHVQSYFRDIYRDYQDSVGRESIAGVHERIKALLAPHMTGLVLDVGSGGVSDFASGADRTVVALDNVFEFLRDGRTAGVLSVAGDVRALPLKAGSVDRIIVQHVIHHLTSDVLAENLRNVRAAIAESARVLAPGGRLFIIDSTTTRGFDMLQRWVYTISYAALKALGKPMVFMFSSSSLGRICRESGLDPDAVLTIDWGDMNEASQALFPWLRFPLKFTPVRIRLISAVKA